MDAGTQTVTNEIQAIYPANSLQQGFIFHAVSQPKDDAYVVQTLFDYTETLDVDAYRQAWMLTIITYPTLRLCFNWDESPIQIITKNGKPHFAFHDFSNEADITSAIENLQQSDRSLGFDLTQPTLLRLHLIKQSTAHYTLLKTEHHAIADAWSAAIIVNKVHDFYHQLIKGQKPEIKQDTAYLQAQALITKNQTEAQRHWQKTLADIHQANDVNVLFTQPGTSDTFNHVREPREINVSLEPNHYERLKNLVRDEGLTLHGLVQFAWHKLLHTYTGDAQTIVGTTLSGRALPINDIEKSAGLYINTLPLVVRWDNTLTLKEQLHAIHTEIVGLNKNSFVYLSALQRNGERLFNSLLLFENLSFSAEKKAPDNNLTASNRRSIQKLNYPIALTFYINNNTLVINFKYDGTYLTDQHANTLLKQLCVILQQIPCKFHGPHHSIDLLTKEETTKIMHEWNATDADYPSHATLHDLFEQQVVRTPHAIALVFQDQQLTYTELNEKANQLAHFLHQKNLTRGELVALCLDRSLELMIAILGVLKAGCAYVPMDPHLPIDRITYVLKNTESRFLLTQTHHESHLKTMAMHDLQCVMLDQHPYHAATTAPLTLERNPNDLAYVIFTSGTTGNPKGVAITHGGAVNRLHWMQKTYPLDESDAVLQKTPYSFDVSVWELLWAHWTGAKIVMAKPDGHKDPDYLHTLIQKEKITVLHFVPSMLSAFTEALISFNARAANSLRYVFCSGEALFANQVAAFYNVSGNAVQIHNLYGPTEASIDVTAFACPRGVENVTIGRPIQNTRAYVLTAHLKPVPIGAVGELYLGGAGLAREYWRQPELTKAAFIPNPFATQDDIARGYTRLYKTGDRVRWQQNGNIEYLGRFDSQVKVRGFRIELSEIEQVMLSYPGVTQVVAMIKENKTQDHTHRFIAAYYVGDIAHTEMRKYLAQHLPDYMVPTSIIALTHFPVTANGKLDRKALPLPSFMQENTDTAIAPRTPLEKKLCAVWEKVLKVASVNITDNFFDLGGDSIRSIRLVSKMQDMGFPISVNDLFKYKTILQLIEKGNTAIHYQQTAYAFFSLIDENTRKNHAADPIEDIYPAGLLQIGMLVESLKKEANGTYHDVFSYTIKQPLDTKWLLTVFKQLSHKHPLLRTAFIEHVDYGYICLQYADIDIDSHFGGIIEETLPSFVMSEKNRSFQIEEPGLFSLFVLNPTDTEFTFVFSFHHAITDGWSVASLLSEFVNAYTQKIMVVDEAIPFYQKVIQQERLALNSELHKAFWSEHLKDAPQPKQKLIYYPNALTTDPVEMGFTMTDENAKAILTRAKEFGVSVDTLFLSAYFKTASRFLNQSDPVLGVVMNTRLEETGGEKVFGLHLNTLPLRLTVDENAATQTTRLSAIRTEITAHKAYPYGKIRADLMQGHDVYTLAFNYMHFHTANEKNPSFESSYIFEKTTIPLTLHVARDNERFRVAIKALPGVIDSKTAALLLNYLQHDLKAITDNGMFSWLSEQHIELLRAQVIPEEKNAVIDSTAAYRQPRNTFEVSLCDIWKSILSVSKIGIDDNFFELGGDSISCIRLIAKMKSIGFYVTVADIFKHKTIFNLIENTNHVKETSKITYVPYSLIDKTTKEAFSKSDIEDLYPASYLQIGMLVESLKPHADGAYHDVFAFTVHSTFDEERLLKIFESLSIKHPLLRTAFLAHTHYGYTCAQYRKIDIRAHFGGVIKKDVSTFIAAEKNRSFSINNPGLFSLFVLNPTDDQFVIIFSFHHAITDGWSVASLLSEFTDAYANKRDILNEIIPPYQAVIQEEQLALSNQTHEIFWKTYLKNSPRLLENLLFHPDAGLATESSQVLDTTTSNALLSTAKYMSLSPDTLFLAAYFKTLSRFFNTHDVVTGVVINNRLETINGDKVFGLHLNTLPLRIFVGDNSTELTKALSKQRAELESHKAYPYAKIRIDLLSGSDAYICAFNYMHFHVMASDKKTLESNHVFEKTTVPLTLHVSRHKNSFTLSIKAQEGFVDQTTMQLLLEYLQHDLNTVIAKEKFDWLHKEDEIRFQRFLRTYQNHQKMSLPVDTVQPRNAIEESLCAIWKDTLNLKNIGITDNFFSMGGDSILSVRLVAKMQEIGMIASVSDIFKYPTILALTENITPKNKSVAESYKPFSLIDATTLRNHENDDIEDIYPASYLQMGMLIESLKSHAEGTYHDVFAYTIHHPFQEEKVVQVFQALSQKHPLLRTAFLENADYGYLSIQYKKVKIRSHISIVNAQSITDFIHTEKNRPFNIDQPGLFHLFILNPAQDQFVLVFSFHHAITDGWSVASLLSEFTSAYTQDKWLLDEKIPLYQKVIQQERMALSSHTHESFWRDYLNNAPSPLENMFFHKNSSSLTESAILLDNNLSMGVLHIAKQLNTSPDTLFLSAFSKTISRFTNNNDVVVGWVMNHRLEESNGDKVFGLHLNTLPFRIRIENNGRQQTIAISQQKSVLNAYRAYPLAKIRTNIMNGIDPYTIAFNYMHFHISDSESKSLSTVQVFEKTNIPLTLQVSRHGNGFRASLKALPGFIDITTAQTLLSYLQNDLKAIIENNTFGWLSSDDETLFQEWNRVFLKRTESESLPEKIMPRNAFERSLCDVWENVLNIPSVSMTDNFFELGGDSILSIRLIAKMKSVGLNVSVNDIFTHKCILQLIENVDQTTESIQEKYEPFSLIDEATRLKNSNKNSEDIYPASYLQMGMLIASLKEEAEGTYHDVFAYTINHPFNENLLLTLFKSLVLKHPLLRTAFIPHKEYGYLSLQYADIDISSHFGGVLETDLPDFIDSEKNNSFSIEEPGLFRLFALNVKPDTFIFVLSFHHAITDGWSIASLMNEFVHAYTQNKPIVSEKLPLYQQVIQKERISLQSPAQNEFWQVYLKTAPLPKPNLLFHPNAGVSFESGLPLEDDVANDVLVTAKKQGVSPDHLFMAAYFKTLSRLSNQNDIVIGIVMNNRLEEENGDKLFGLHLNTLPLRLTITDDSSILVEKLSQQKIVLDKYKSYPYGKIHTDIMRSKELWHCAFNYIHFHVVEDSLDSRTLSAANFFEKTNVPFTLHVLRQKNTFRVFVKSLNGFIDEETMRYFMAYFSHDLQTIIHQGQFSWIADTHKILFESWQDNSIIASQKAPILERRMPSTALEKSLCAIWENTLNVKSVGITDNFFELGGDSIRAIRLVAKMQESGCHISLNDIFKHKTIIALIEKTEQDKIAKLEPYTPFSLIDDTTQLKILSKDIEDIYPAGHFQTHMLTESLKPDGDGIYHDVFAYKIQRPFSEDSLLTAFKSLSQKHPVLRTAFKLDPEHGYLCIQFREIDISLHYSHLGFEDVSVIIDREKNNAFPIETAGLFRLIVLNTTPDQFVFLFSFHHAIADGWSVASLISEFTAAYTGIKAIASENIPPFQRVIQHERLALKNDTHRDFWHNYLKNVPSPIRALSTIPPRYHGTFEISLSLSNEKSANVLAHAKRLSVSPDMVFLAAFSKALSSLTNQSENTIGLVMNNRLEETNAEKVFGLHLNILPIRTRIDANDTQDKLISLLAEERARFIPHKAYPYEKLCLDLNRPDGFYTVALNYTHFYVNDHQTKEVLIQPIHAFEKMAIPFILQIVRYQNTFTLIARTSEKFSDRETAKALVRLVSEQSMPG